MGLLFLFNIDSCFCNHRRTVVKATQVALTTERLQMKEIRIGKERLTERDVEVAIWIAEQGCARLDSVGLMLVNMGSIIGTRQLRKLAVRWEQLGLVHRERLLAKAPAILWTTRYSVQLAGISLGRGQKVVKPSFSTLHHELAVAHIRTIYEAHGAKWLSEARIREDYEGHLPDAIATVNEVKIVVEIDRTRKSGSRLDAIMSENALAINSDFVDYWVSPDLIEFMTKQLGNLPRHISGKIRLFPIPGELL